MLSIVFNEKVGSLHRHPRESGDPYVVCYSMDPRFRGDDGVGISVMKVLLMSKREFMLSDEASLLNLATKLAPAIFKLNTIFLSGDLGVGKTTFVRGFLNSLGYTGAVKSPTYALVEDYFIQDKAVYHFDWYRISDSESLEAIGIREYFSQNALCLIEWPEHATGLQLVPDWRLTFYYHPQGRLVHVESESELGQRVLKELSS